MNSLPAEPTGRWPLKSRNVELFRALARWLARCGVAPNAISFGSMIFAAGAGAAFVATRFYPPTAEVVCWLAAAGFVQLRLLANLLDGLVAVEGGKSGPTGDLWNEAPDRVADTLIFLGLGFASESHPTLGFSAALGAIFVAYTRALGASLGAEQLFIGPMAKQHRMFVVTLLCVWNAIVSLLPGRVGDALSTGVAELYLQDTYYVIVGPMFLPASTFALGFIIIGCVITAVRRLLRIAAFLRGRALR